MAAKEQHMIRPMNGPVPDRHVLVSHVQRAFPNTHTHTQTHRAGRRQPASQTGRHPTSRAAPAGAGSRAVTLTREPTPRHARWIRVHPATRSVLSLSLLLLPVKTAKSKSSMIAFASRAVVSSEHHTALLHGHWSMGF